MKMYLKAEHFHILWFARRLVFKQRNKATRKWPILLCVDPFLTAAEEYLTADYKKKLDIYTIS